MKSNADKSDTDKLKIITSNLSNLKTKVGNLDVDKLVHVPVDLSELSDAVKKMMTLKMYIMLRSKILKRKYLILLT